MNQEIVNKIKNNHVFGWKGIVTIIKARKYPRKRPFKICVAIAILLFACAYFNKNNSYELLLSIANTNVSIFPALTGFSLTAFSVCINFGNLTIAKNSIKVDGISIYQNAIGIFAFSIAVQASVLVTSYAIKVSDKFPRIEVCDCLTWIVNALFIAVLGFLTTFALYLIFTIVSNIFTFGQLNNLQNTKDNFVKTEN